MPLMMLISARISALLTTMLRSTVLPAPPCSQPILVACGKLKDEACEDFPATARGLISACSFGELQDKAGEDLPDANEMSSKSTW